MKYTHLGRTGLQVSRLCLGTMNYGPHADEADSHAQMDRAHELGINFFDTADVYGWERGEGITEKILGTWFAGGGRRRERTILATKVFGQMNADPLDLTMDRGLSAVKIRRACEDSLRRLQTDYIDLYQMHHVSRETAVDEILQAFETLVAQGKILYMGTSNFPAWAIAELLGSSKARHFLGPVCEQTQYSLVVRQPELEVLPACERFGVGAIPWSPLAGGILGGVLQKEKSEGARRYNENASSRLEKVRPQVEQWEAFCAQRGEQPADVALAWTLHHPAVTAPIIGPRTLAQLDGSIRATEITLDEDALRAIDRIFPGPKGATKEGVGDWKQQAAPEAYSW